MSLFLSDWEEGPFVFMAYAEVSYAPSIHCALKDNNLKTYSYVFKPAMMHDLTCALGKDLGQRFKVRLYDAVSVVLRGIHLQDFLKTNLDSIYAKSGHDLIKTSETMSKLFEMLLVDYEFWNKLDVIEVISNLIFYDVPYDPKPFMFVVPPMSEWDSGIGWFPED